MQRIAFLCATTVGSLLGCETLVGPSPTVENLKVSVAVSRSSVPAGDTLSILVRAFNPTDEPIELPPSPCTALAFRVFSPKGERVASSEHRSCGFINGPPPSAVPANDSLQMLHRWATVSNYGESGPADPLPPDTYTVVGVIAGESEGTAMSEPVELSVHPQS